MAVSDISGNRPRVARWRKLVGRVSRYDLVLAAIPFVFAVAVALSALGLVPFLGAVAAGAVVSAGLLVDVLYLNPPSGPDRSPDAPRTGRDVEMVTDD